MMRRTEIILPKRIAVLREQPNQDIKVKNEEFNLYFKNFIYPLYPWQDIVIECKYGKNMGFCWRICDYPNDVDEFKLTVKVYDESGECVAEKETAIELYDQDVTEPFKLICIGDSLTQHMTYVHQIQNRLKNVFTCGSRSYDGHVFAEGRAGWSYDLYMNKHSLEKGERGATNWTSPFLFPKGISGEEYFGDMEYYEASLEKNRSTCCFDGFEFPEIKDGQYYHKQGKLYKMGLEEAVLDEVEWEFNLKKYLAKNHIGKINAVSLLMGANDLYPYTYDEVEDSVRKYIENIKFFVKAIRDADEKIDVIINLPVPGSEQAGFGKVRGCDGTYMAYNYKIREASKAILREFEDYPGVHICPMSHVLDVENGYDKVGMRANLYCDTQIMIKDDTVHPNSAGYRQMGDALAGTVEMLRHKKGGKT